ncbi:manganese-dependent inorganic pyrophosphatase [Gordonia sp. 852002-50816_SCH5313054-c]|uniref:manganese-dependent inorganic pyrophosphatase n=1 Tax=unclassified Gordonia (in: high G+C Gram-positive bacteria) TaxID=2657482 RepID=UPI0007EA5225|nr:MULTISPECIES: manganese-dependent inorganic pyrophosphatase [unclassified Gordonia (in: high G+C Gram-positive bacteria)]OBC15199.1 manganese-dependent inorganic pyrophosphatase [Gordonia sp. 852002-50816_SCH5313054-c]OBC15257.1 manganese-dependent inorganic pyrophosphatase [Gordonia sp. 852002-50816_SCH5313054-a]
MSKVFVFGHRNPDTDAIASAIAMAHLERSLDPTRDVEAVALGSPGPETRYALDHFGIEAPRVIERARPEADGVMLVDHNERQQSVADLADVTIHKVVDHHRIANFETAAPLWFRAEPVGCTCTILHRMFGEKDLTPPRDVAGLMVSAIISDTLLLHSPTTTDLDRAAATELAERAGIDLDGYGTDLLRAGSDVGDASAAELIDRDAKSYTMGSTTVRVAQINTVDVDSLLARRDEFLAAMNAEARQQGYDLFLLLLTDVLKVDSDLLVVGSPVEAVEKALGVTVRDGHAKAPGIVSRKKQIVPQLTEVLRST